MARHGCTPIKTITKPNKQILGKNLVRCTLTERNLSWKTSLRCQCLDEPQYPLQYSYDVQLAWLQVLSGTRLSADELESFFDRFSITVRTPPLRRNWVPWQLSPSKAVTWIPKVRICLQQLGYPRYCKRRQRENSTKFCWLFCARDQSKQSHPTSHSAIKIRNERTFR